MDRTIAIMGATRAMTSALLIVEDDNDIAAVYTELFVNEGFEVLTVFDGRQALETIASHPVDLVVSDIRMPEMDGVELATEIRRRGLGLPIVLVSAVESGYRVRHLDNVTFLKKPVDIDDLINTVAGLLS